MIGYLLKMYPRFSETFILGEILEMERRGRDLAIISLKKPDDGRFHEDLSRVRAGVQYIPERFPGHPLTYLLAHLRALRRPGAYFRIAGLTLLHLPWSWKAFLRAPLVAERALSAGCSRLHAHFASLPAVTAMLTSILAGLPFTFTAHAKDIFLRGRSRRLLRLMIVRAERVVTVSEFNQRWLADLAGPCVPCERIVRIYNGVDLERFAPSSSRMSDDPPLILAIGRLVDKKGFADLVEACAILHGAGLSFRCEIVGKGPLREDLERRIAEHALAGIVRLAGPLPQAEVSRRLRSAALLAAPCVIGKDGNRDGLPQVILEAMASGLPLVATRVTGIPEAVQDGVTGKVVEPGRPALLADALAELISDADLRIRMGCAARQSAEALFDRRANVALLYEILSDETMTHPGSTAAVVHPAGGRSLSEERP